MEKKFINIALILLLILFLSYSTIYADSFKLGDNGSEIKRIQQLLYKLGYDITVDGFFGYQTKEIVKDFQLNNGLKVDGVVGQKTLDLLEEMAKDIKYIVQNGDTLSEIAYKFHSTVEAIKEKNNLKSDKIIIGEEILIPKTGIGGGEEDRLYSNIYHEVQRGDSLSVLAKKYGSDIETIKLANKLKSNRIYVGQTLMIPHLKRGINQPFLLKKGSFIWPVIGRISSGYGYRIHPIKGRRELHGGIDIAVPVGTKIRAAASGKVIQSGWISGFGKTIVIDHGDGVRTLYGHNYRLLVRAGSNVNLGQVIALAGSTGLSTGPHLDFRIYKDGKTVNPIKYLP